MLRIRPGRDPLKETIELSPGIRALPIVHGSVEFTVLVRELLLEHSPALLALEIPERLAGPLNQVVEQADNIPVIEIESNDRADKSYFIMEPLEPLVEALRTGLEKKIPCHFIDSFGEPVQGWLPESFPDTFALRSMSTVNLYQLYEKYRSKGSRGELDLLIEGIDYRRELKMVQKLRNLAKLTSHGESFSDTLLVICGFRHIAGLRRLLEMPEEKFNTELEVLQTEQIDTGKTEKIDPAMAEPLELFLTEEMGDALKDAKITISYLSRQSPEVLEQPAYFNTAWNFMRKNLELVRQYNRIALQRTVYRDCVNRYERESGELVSRQKEKQFFRFTRNWSIVENRLLPDIYRLVVAARGFMNDTFARMMYETLNFLPPLNSTDFPEKKVTLDDLHRESRYIRFRFKYKIKRNVPPPPILRSFKREKYPGEWRDAWQDGGICSYPPEDIKIEDFGRYLQKQSTALIHGSESRTQPFTSSLLDGIDYRETIRNLHLGKIFVKDLQTKGYDAGSVVVIFSEDIEEYNWQVVWWGEHEQESDMAFYATHPGTQMAGPGICRCRYGGFLLTYPPGRLHDIWQDDFYGEFVNPADRLLAAALEYNEKNTVVHLSIRRPNQRLVDIAGRMGQKIIHIPISSISSVELGRVQRFHVLDSRNRRDDAGDYIW